MDFNKLSRQVDFIIEIDKMKQILRNTILMDASRRENDAEHSWHMAVGDIRKKPLPFVSSKLAGNK